MKPWLSVQISGACLMLSGALWGDPLGEVLGALGAILMGYAWGRQAERAEYR